jgi:hypothetical protein
MLLNKAMQASLNYFLLHPPFLRTPHGQHTLPFTYLLLLPSSAGLLGRGRRIQGFATLFLLSSFIFFSVDGKGGGVDNALRGRGGGGGEDESEIKSIKAALIY